MFKMYDVLCDTCDTCTNRGFGNEWNVTDVPFGWIFVAGESDRHYCSIECLLADLDNLANI